MSTAFEVIVYFFLYIAFGVISGLGYAIKKISEFHKRKDKNIVLNNLLVLVYVLLVMPILYLIGHLDRLWAVDSSDKIIGTVLILVSIYFSYKAFVVKLQGKQEHGRNDDTHD